MDDLLGREGTQWLPRLSEHHSELSLAHPNKDAGDRGKGLLGRGGRGFSPDAVPNGTEGVNVPKVAQNNSAPPQKTGT